MRTVPLDLKRRIVEAYERKEGRYFELAKRFGVGEATVYRLLKLKRERGSIELGPHACGEAALAPGRQTSQVAVETAPTPSASRARRAKSPSTSRRVPTEQRASRPSTSERRQSVGVEQTTPGKQEQKDQ